MKYDNIKQRTYKIQILYLIYIIYIKHLSIIFNI